MGNNDYKKTIIYFLFFILLIIVCIFAYKNLSTNYTEGNLKAEIELEEEIKRATNFTVFTADNVKVRMLDFKGKPIVVNFWASWCGPCRVELPAFEELYNKYGDKVQFMMVNLTDEKQEKKQDVEGFISTGNYTFPVFFDTNRAAHNTYNLYQIPKTIFVNKDGNLIYSHTGAMSKSTIEKYIKYMLGE